jgi:hypothetical protein
LRGRLRLLSRVVLLLECKVKGCLVTFVFF